MLWKIIVYVCCFLSGLFFGTFIFTCLENASKGFRNFVRTVCDKIPRYFRTIIMWVMILVLGYTGFAFLNIGNWGGIIMGTVSGIFMYFRAGITLGNNPDPYNKERKQKQKNLSKSKDQKKARKIG